MAFPLVLVGFNKNNTIPDSLTKLINYRGAENTFLGNVTLFSSKYKENNQSYKANFKLPLNVWSSISGYFKFGGDYKYEHHKNDQETPYVRLDRTSALQRTLMDDFDRTTQLGEETRLHISRTHAGVAQSNSRDFFFPFRLHQWRNALDQKKDDRAYGLFFKQDIWMALACRITTHFPLLPQHSG